MALAPVLGRVHVTVHGQALWMTRRASRCSKREWLLTASLGILKLPCVPAAPYSPWPLVGWRGTPAQLVQIVMPDFVSQSAHVRLTPQESQTTEAPGLGRFG
jgi:hypothetical protein